MWQLDFLYRVSGALDIVALSTTVFFPILALVSLTRSGWRQGQITIAYLGYICCAALVASFALHFGLEGGDIYMMFDFWLIPFAVAAVVAVLVDTEKVAEVAPSAMTTLAGTVARLVALLDRRTVVPLVGAG